MQVERFDRPNDQALNQLEGEQQQAHIGQHPSQFELGHPLMGIVVSLLI